MKKRVLILSFPDDFHALAIQTLLTKHDAEADIVDTGAFPTELTLAHRGDDFADVLLNGRPLSEYHAIWNRRAKPPRLSSDITSPEEADFAARECAQALWGAIYASGLPIYNRPEQERLAGFKPYQLKVARELGLRIPDTLITNSEEEARAFARKHTRVIYKTFSGTTWRMMDTRPLTEEDMADLWRVRYAPLIFQEFLERGREYRVSIVENDCFAGEIVLDNPEARYDWRLDDNHGVVKTELPEDIRARLMRLRAALHLNSGAIDLRETPDGRIYFLEINPTGQFLFLDVFGGMDVANRFCEMLLQ
jgi:glutathione synthase/RimK-type ligase-like ATP-grasp enzyme